jgi:transglycosylase-like protein with SLT domain/PT repeat-containing protein
MTRHCSVGDLLAIVVAVLLVVHSAPALADESSLRERSPDEITSTPTPEQELGDGTALSSEVAVATEETGAAPADERAPAEQTASGGGSTSTDVAASAKEPAPAIVPIEATTETAGEASEFEVRPKPTPRTFANPAAKAGSRVPKVPRLDDSVLRWLPEIEASAEANKVPAELIAGIVRIESDGNPNIISPDGARGLMQIMPDQLLGQGITDDLWHDPATNIMAGGYELLERSWSYGSWEGAVGSYFGFGCDVFGTCTDVYIAVVFGWAAYYAPIIASPLSFGFAVLPKDWAPPPIVPFVEASPVPVEEAPPPPAPVADTPSPTATASATPTTAPTDAAGSPTAEPTEGPTDVPTEGPTEVPTDEPVTDTPTAVPTDEPTDVPTAEPTVEPTVEPTEVPTDVPTEEPTEEPTEAPIDVPTDAPTDVPTDETGSGVSG